MARQRSAALLLGLALGLQSTPAYADAIDDEVAEYIREVRKMILREPEDSSETVYNYNQEYQDANADFVRQKYAKMKENVLKARNDNERAKAMRVMKAEALKEAVDITEANLLK
ncbi:unnamed protein product [Symbiodinium natans]|uniref:Uncharacterized protein n=1 Tax=Symbiodinium natans TaxID=878477 RepID=A0A812MBL2_9DINO|nr:unnamed protein product [Symbiodinium natans]